MRITNSQAKTFQRCKRQYDYKYGQLLTPLSVGLPLKRGSWLHELLEADLRGLDWHERNEELAVEFNRLFDEEKERYGNLPLICENIMEAYTYHWREERKGWNVLAVEEKYEVELPNGHTLVFKVDGIVEDDYGVWLLEHKSHKTIPNDNYRFIDIQSARYWWGLTQLDWKIEGVIWDYIRTKEPSKPELLKDGTRLSKRKIDTDLFTFVSALKEYGLDPRDYRDVILRLKQHNNFFRRERVPKPPRVAQTLVEELVHVADEIEGGYHPDRSIERGCAFSCDFLEVCMTELYGGDAEQIRKLRYRVATEDDYYGLEGLAEGLQAD